MRYGSARPLTSSDLFRPKAAQLNCPISLISKRIGLAGHQHPVVASGVHSVSLLTNAGIAENLRHRSIRVQNIGHSGCLSFLRPNPGVVFVSNIDQTSISTTVVLSDTTQDGRVAAENAIFMMKRTEPAALKNNNPAVVDDPGARFRYR
jgi:hypothetical protein